MNIQLKMQMELLKNLQLQILKLKHYKQTVLIHTKMLINKFTQIKWFI